MRNLETLQEMLIKEGPTVECVVEPVLKSLYHTSNLPSGWSVHRLRLDWEIAWAGNVFVSDHQTNIPMMMSMVQNDLQDILVNGDVDSNIAGLSVMDGEKKRGEKFLDSGIVSGVFYVDPKMKKQSTEYTLYVLFATR